MRVITASQMKQAEQRSELYHVSTTRLMENAGSAATAFIRRSFTIASKNCIIFCGSGNNGGDGFVVARKLYEEGANVIVVLTGNPPTSGDALTMYNFVVGMQLPLLSIIEQLEQVTAAIGHTDLIIDAIYGIGFRGDLVDWSLKACMLINSANCPVIALDTPSGIICDTGSVSGNAVAANFTVAFDCLKPLHLFEGSAELCGQIECVPIGIPEEAYAGITSMLYEIAPDMVWSSIPRRAKDSHKGTYGKVLSICGSPNYPGAAVLSSMGVLRTGAGLCCIVSHPSVCYGVVNKIPEVIIMPIDDEDTTATNNTISSQLVTSKAVLFGCGRGDSQMTLEILKHLLKNTKVPLVIDADGLNALSKNLDLLNGHTNPIIITPHPGEMAHLCGITTENVQSHRYQLAWTFAKQYNVYVVLKGNGTITATPEGQLFLNKTGNSGLAKGGSGDILAGMISSFLAQGFSPEIAITNAVWLHGAAADRCALRKSQYSMLPSDIMDDLGELFLENIH